MCCTRLPTSDNISNTFNPAARTLTLRARSTHAWHVVGCLYWRVATHWLLNMVAVKYFDKLPPEQYLYAMFWVVGTTSGTVSSFGEPQTPGQIGFTLMCLVIGLFMYGVIIGSLASLVSSLNSIGEAKNQKLQAIREYLIYKRVPHKLKKAILQYYTFLWGSVQLLDEAQVMADLPPVLQLQIDIVATKSIFSRITLFRFFPMEGILLLVQRIQPVLTLPGEVIMQQGQQGKGLFFIVRGEVSVIKGDTSNAYPATCSA